MFVSQKSFIYVIAIACPSPSIPLPGNPIGPNPSISVQMVNDASQIHPTIPEAKKHFNSVRRCPPLEAGHNGTRDTLEQDDRGVQTSWVGALIKIPGHWERGILSPPMEEENHLSSYL